MNMGERESIVFGCQRRSNMILVVAALAWLLNVNIVLGFAHSNGFGEQPLSKIAIHKTVVSLHSTASITATPALLGTKVAQLVP